MAADGTSIKTDIDTNLANKGYRGIRVANVITALKNVVDWVASAVNANLTTWLRSSDNLPGGGNGDHIYRTGLVELRGGANFRTRTQSNAAFGLVSISNEHALQILGNNGGPAWIEFHLPGQLIHAIGVDTDGVLKFRPWSNPNTYPIVISGSSEMFALAPNLSNRKISLYGIAQNEHQFFGLGINSNVLRYQIGGTIGGHIFYAGTSPVTSNELMRIGGDGKVGIGAVAPTSLLHLAGIGHQQLRLENGFTPANSADGNGMQGQIAWDNNYIYVKTGAGWKRSALTSW